MLTSRSTILFGAALLAVLSATFAPAQSFEKGRVARSLTAQGRPSPVRTWSVEVNLLWPIFPGNLYSAKVLRTLYANQKTSGEAYLGLSHRPYEFRADEGQFSNSALLFGYRQYIWKGLNAEWYNAIGPGRINSSVVDGRNYRSTDYEVGLLLGYIFRFNMQRKLPLYLNIQPVGFSYIAYQSNPHPIVGQSGERPFYFGSVQFGVQL